MLGFIILFVLFSRVEGVKIAQCLCIQLCFINTKIIRHKMAEFHLDIKEIQNQEAALTISELFLDTAIDEKGLRKEFVQNFFANALNNLENQSTSPKTKFYTLFILKELSTKDKITLKIFGTFAQHPLYAFLEQLALTVDPKKPVSEKGKSLFPTDKQMGNNFMRLLLESLVTWGNRFPTNSKKEPTRFKKTLTKLQEEKVVMPKEFAYYQPNQKKSERAETPQGPTDPASNKGVSNDSISNAPSAPTVPKVKDSKEKQFAEIKFMHNKIDTLLGILEDSDSVQELQRQIQSYHLKFQKDMQKLQEIEGQVVESGDEQLMHLYFKVVEFFNEERLLFKENVSKNQYDVYITGYGIAYERIFEEKKESKPTSKLEPSIDKKLSQSKPELSSKTNALPPKPIQKIKSEKIETINQDSRLAEKQNLKKKGSERDGAVRENRPVERDGRLKDNKNVIEACFSKLETYSKSPHQGFGSIAKSLEKEKKPVVVSRIKTSNVVTNMNKSKFTGASTFSKSAVKLKGIFAAPPNPNIRAKSYEGEVVTENLELSRQLESMKKEQGMRRLKASLFKNKYILYEDECIQLGFKSVAVYEKVDKFTSMIDFQLFFGNKTAKTIDKFEVAFKGDKQSLIYTNPQVVDSTIFPESQVKLELLNIPKMYPFGLVCINASYESCEETRNFSALLPNSILQMTSYFPLQVSKLDDIWKESPKVLKTDAFKLCHYFPPDQLQHFLPALREKTPYSRFAEEGCTTDYELFCELVIRESFDGLLKIVVRPDLSVVLQAALYAGEDDHVQNFQFYLQSLEAALQETES